MMMRVATFAISDQMIAAAQRTQSVMANDQLEQASGVTSTDYGGLGETSGQVINLQISVARSQSYVDAATGAVNKANVMYTSVTSIANLLSSFRATLTAASNSASTDPTSVTEAAQQGLQSMASLLNAQFGSEYVFGGSDTTNPPVDVSNSAYPPISASAANTANTSYYQGDDQIASVRVSDSQTVPYGVTADNSAFEQGLRALNLVANTSPLTSATLTQALNLTISAVNATAAVQTSLGLASSSMQAASDAQTEYQNFAQTLSSNLDGVDVAAVTAQLSTYQAQLDASYSAIAKIQSLNLASFLH